MIRAGCLGIIVGLVLVCAGCGARYRGGELPPVEPAVMKETGLAVTWDIETNVGPVGPKKVVDPPSPRAELIEQLFLESGVFDGVERAAKREEFHIQVIDRSWWVRSGWETASVLLSIITLGVIPGYTKDDYDLEFRIQTANGERSYRYKDSVKTLWGLWGLILPREEYFIIVPGGSTEAWGKDPTGDVLVNMIRQFLVDVERDYGSQ